MGRLKDKLIKLLGGYTEQEVDFTGHWMPKAENGLNAGNKERTIWRGKMRR